MMTKSKLVLSAGLIAVAMTTSMAPAEATHKFWHGAAVGAAAGLIIGGALAQPGYAEPAPVYAAPAPVYVQPAPQYYAAPRPRRPHCETYVKYDQYGRPYEWTDCN